MALFSDTVGSRLPSTAFALLLLSACSEAGTGSHADRRVTTESSEVSLAGLVTAREERTVSEPVESPEPASPSPQSGNLTAGDHDDILNPELYVRYASRIAQQARDLPFIDTRTRVAVKVVDAAGAPVPHARVSVSRAGAPLQLMSGADGIASFYPRFDGLNDQARITVHSDLGEASRSFRLGSNAGQTVQVKLPGQGHGVTAMDVVLVLDTTGSMGDEMAYLQAELETIVGRLKRDAGQIDLRIGLVVYRDEGDDYVVRSYPLTSDLSAMRAMLARQSADGGGDMPEAMDSALVSATAMAWRPDAAKALLLVADAPPHEAALRTTMDITGQLRTKGVQIVPVAASGVEDSAQFIMRAMAVLTQGRYIFLTDDSGIGDPHAEPDLACYVVTRLDQLIARVLAGIAQGRRIEPAQGEVIRAVGDYDRGRCRSNI